MANLFDQSSSRSSSSTGEDQPSSITGTIESIVYHSEDTHYTVARFKTDSHHFTITVVGNLPSVTEGEKLKVYGDWITHPQYGRQFQIETHHPVSPDTLDGIIGYLGSGMVEGIGKKLAGRLVDRFGLDTLDVIENQPERLREVPGLGKKRVEKIVEEFKAKKGDQASQIFLRSLGLTGVTLQNIYRRYKDKAAEVVKSNPYILMEQVHNIGFKKADKIADRLGIPSDSPERTRAALAYVLRRGQDDGSVCLPRDELIPPAARLVGRGEDEVAAVLQREIDDNSFIEEDGYIYRPYMHNLEFQAAHRVLEMVAEPEPSQPFPGHLEDREYTDEQRSAIEAALREKVLILTGGPGVGKTYTVMGMVQALRSKNLQVSLCAPTGRAAKRMGESTGYEAKTIHRLLKFQPGRGFHHRGDNPLESDAVVVDESSMIDLPLFVHLLDALPSHARLILVGDKDQLPPVGPGSPFRDLIESGLVHTTYLTEIFRQQKGSTIIENAHRIQKGEFPPLDNQEDSDFFFIENSQPMAVVDMIQKMILERIPARFGLDSREDVQILTPMRNGTLGYESLNQSLQHLLNPDGQVYGQVGPYSIRRGDRVMQIKNNYDKEVFNGDMGKVVDRDKKGVIVDYLGRKVVYGKKELGELVLAYAISIHKSQGSEYPAVIIPIAAQHTIMLRRNLVYTALTRGMKLAVMVGEKRCLRMAIQRVGMDRRHGRLCRLLQGDF